jgi:hypothetical protein
MYSIFALPRHAEVILFTTMYCTCTLPCMQMEHFATIFHSPKNCPCAAPTVYAILHVLKCVYCKHSPDENIYVVGSIRDGIYLEKIIKTFLAGWLFPPMMKHTRKIAPGLLCPFAGCQLGCDFSELEAEHAGLL